MGGCFGDMRSRCDDAKLGTRSACVCHNRDRADLPVALYIIRGLLPRTLSQSRNQITPPYRSLTFNMAGAGFLGLGAAVTQRLVHVVGFT